MSNNILKRIGAILLVIVMMGTAIIQITTVPFSTYTYDSSTFVPKITPQHYDTRASKRILLSDNADGSPKFAGQGFGKDDTRAASGNYSYNDSPGSTYSAQEGASLTSVVVIDLTNAVNPELSISSYMLCDNFNYVSGAGGTILVSTDGGSNWASLDPQNTAGNYDMQVNQDFAGYHIDYIMTGHDAGWSTKVWSLAPYVGASNFKIMFLFFSVDAGNTGDEGWYIDDIVVQADNTPPEAPMLLKVQDDPSLNAEGVVRNPSGDVELSWTCEDPDGDEIQSVLVHLATSTGVNSDDPGTPDNFKVFWGYVNASGGNPPTHVNVNVDEGTVYHWAIKCFDGFDWSPWSKEYSFQTNHRPVATIVSITPDQPREHESVTLVGSSSDADNDAITDWEWKSSLDGVLGNSETIVVDNGLSEGTHLITFRVKDVRGEWSDPAEQGVVVIGNNPPIIDDYQPSDDNIVVNQGDTKTFTVDAHDPDTGNIISYEWYLDDDIKDIGATYKLKTTVGGLKDNHVVKCVVSDGVLNVSQSWQVFINAAPRFTSMQPSSGKATINEGESITLSFDAVDDNQGDLMTISWYMDGKIIAGATGKEYTFTTDYSTARTMPYTIEAHVSDNHGLVSTAKWSITVNNVVQQYYIVENSWDPYEKDVYMKEGQTKIFSIQAKSNDTIIEYYWYLDDVEVGFGSVFTYSPGFQDAGNHTLEVRISDNSPDTEDRSWEWNVNVENVDRPPVAVISLPDLSTYDAGAGKIPFDATGTYDPDDDDTLTYEWYDETGNLIGNKKSFEKELTAGVRTIQLKVIDSHGQFSEARKTITVRAPKVEVISFDFDKKSYYVGEGAKITLLIKNSGVIPARGVNVNIFIGGNPVSSYKVQINPNEVEKIVVPWIASKDVSEISVYISADSLGVINTPSGTIVRYLKPIVKDVPEKSAIRGDIPPLLIPLMIIVLAICVVDGLLLIRYSKLKRLK